MNKELIEYLAKWYGRAEFEYGEIGCSPNRQVVSAKLNIFYAALMAAIRGEDIDVAAQVALAEKQLPEDLQEQARVALNVVRDAVKRYNNGPQLNNKNECGGGRYVALVGNLSEGFFARGPYDDFDSATDAHPGLNVWVMRMEDPSQWDKVNRIK